jgi:type VI secretion system protein VasJ
MANLLEELLLPISDASFCGEDGSYEPEFEAAKAEAEKITENDFGLMAESARKFLTKKSKDMRVLGYLTLGTGLTGSLDDFALAVQAYARLATEHWDAIHPQRPTARSNALKWLNGERNLALLAGVDGGGDYENLKAAHEALVSLQSFCDTKFPDGSPAFGGFIKLVKEIAEKNKPREKPAEAPSGSGSGSGSGGGGGGGGGGARAAAGPVSVAEATISSSDDAFLAVQNAAYFLLEQNRADALAYRLIRMVKWGGISGSLPANGARTMMPAPYPHVLEGFKEMFAGRNWAALVASAEGAFTDSVVLWLDLQRFLCTALQAQGGESIACSKAIQMELAMLLQRSPDLPGLEFDDGTPFADAMTREWLQAEVASALGGGGGGAALAPVKKKGDVGEEQKQAEALLGEGKLEQAMNVLRTGLANDASEKNNFDRRLIMAELCYKGNKPNIARAILEDLAAVAEKHGLAGWDPDLCVSVYHLSQKVYLGLADTADEPERTACRDKALRMHAQIARLNPVLAITADFK